ncbi:MAG: inorganic phosphate transporter [Bacteroidales bacterium]|nr:inorganic phosphate transporter [Bacteroidales bacterium]
MEYFIIVALVILVIFAITDLTVGVANDAVNFLNSAWGSKAGSVKMLMIIVSLGVLVGAMFSGGMMEVARKGIFVPQAFYLDEIVILFVAVMMTDVILLDFFNTMGLPTSTTVSLVFALLGSSFALAVIKIVQAGEGMADLSNYLNSGKAMAIIAGIFLSVVIAFVVGMIVQYIARILFSFTFKRYRLIGGSIFGGIAISSISYFIFFKGMKSVSFITDEMMTWTTDHIIPLVGALVLSLTILFFVLQTLFKFNVFRFIVLYGTFALAMAFASNDLVNFIGVPLAGISAFELFQQSGAVDPSTFSMAGLAEKAEIPLLFLFIAGAIMIVTIWSNKKLRSVLNTAIDLGRQDEGKERFHSSPISRGILHAAVKLNQLFSFLRLKKVHNWLDSRFENPSDGKKKKDAPAFDMVRASVNLSVASSLIAFATSLKLPLSTTYVTFMVAMGTSLSDRAWGRESAVYRISGVLTVVGGWFLTAFIAFLFAAIVVTFIYYTGWVGLIVSFALAVFLFLRSHFVHRKKFKEQQEAQEAQQEVVEKSTDLISLSRKAVKKTLNQIPEILDLMHQGLKNEDLSVLKDARKMAKNLDKKSQALKEEMNSSIESIELDFDVIADYHIENVEMLREISVSLGFVVKPAYDHLNNHHKNLNEEQLAAVKKVFDLATDYVKEANKCMEKSVEKLEKCSSKNTEINRIIRKLKVDQLKNVKAKKVTVKSNLLFLNIIGEFQHLAFFIDSLIENELTLKRQFPDI